MCVLGGEGKVIGGGVRRDEGSRHVSRNPQAIFSCVVMALRKGRRVGFVAGYRAVLGSAAAVFMLDMVQSYWETPSHPTW